MGARPFWPGKAWRARLFWPVLAERPFSGPVSWPALGARPFWPGKAWRARLFWPVLAERPFSGPVSWPAWPARPRAFWFGPSRISAAALLLSGAGRALASPRIRRTRLLPPTLRGWTLRGALPACAGWQNRSSWSRRRAPGPAPGRPLPDPIPCGAPLLCARPPMPCPAWKGARLKICPRAPPDPDVF